MLPPGPKLQPEVKPELVNPSAHGGGWCSWAAGARTAAVCSRLGRELFMATEHAVLVAILADALQGLYGDMHWL